MILTHPEDAARAIADHITRVEKRCVFDSCAAG
jgi:hypothetical protein